MKRLVFIILTVLASSLNFAHAKESGKAIIKTNIYCSHCKACETCGQNFQKHLYKLKGLKSFELDEQTMTFTVYYNAKKISLQQIKQGIANLGFDADDVPADKIAYEKLDNCCKKQP